MAKNKKEETTEESTKEPLKGATLPEKDTVIDLSKRVKVEITEDHKEHFYEKGEIIECSPVLASKIANNGWGKVISAIALLLMFAFGGNAQNWNGSSGNNGIMYQPLTPHTPTVPVALDTVTNTGTAYLSSLAKTGTGFLYTTISCNVTKISGTVGGTITLQGSLDNNTAASVGFTAIKTLETQTGVTTVTATDATNTYHWRIYGNPFTYYRVSWTGTGTMAASIGCKIVQR
jgi:hypothetical protein